MCSYRAPDRRVGQSRPLQSWPLSLCDYHHWHGMGGVGGGRHMIPLTLILTQIADIPGTDLGQIRPRFDPVSDSIVLEFANEPAVGSPIRSN